ncbi:hypothetical protein FN846DRAFT_99110 [Sphaerosporella brunnea]|uniref:Uncharacterized protein n=1 Tax=Sphaerosporella brunnea TaxID=1250544 RepID=A0A5J5F9S6_9PEZI|nr:hypothetical protein FN846DRAFT_99110 [Sphaerosporella brunnea]
MAHFLQQADGAVPAAVFAATETATAHLSSHLKTAAEAAANYAVEHVNPALETALTQAGDLIEHVEPVRAHLNEIALRVWEVSDSVNGINSTSLKEMLEPALKLLLPMIDWTVRNPWILLPLLIPAFDAWLVLIGFEAGGVVAGSMAAALQSYIGNVPKGSLFAFLQSNGAGGFARTAFRMAGLWIIVAVLLAAIGKILIERGFAEGEASTMLDGIWNHATGVSEPNHPVSGAVRNMSSTWLWGLIWMAVMMWINM